jgi:multiphosphoryl transfer protein
MVSIVLVSHSAKLAEGVAELAREMGGEGVRIEPAGGLEDGALGTDAMRVMAAVDRAWGDDGVLVLMDLGSAVLSAETALDFLDDEKKAGVLLCEAPIVEGAVAAAVSAKVGAPLAEVAAEARRGLEPKAAHLGEPADADAAPAESGEDGAPWQSVRIAVRNPLGLHARPAARFVQIASGFDADVEVENVSAGRGPASARSLNGIATLGVRQGHEIAVRARGSEAAAALAALQELADKGFGDQPDAPAVIPATAPASEAEPPPAEPGAVLTALPVSPGVGVGPAVRLVRPELNVPREPADDPPAEWERLQRALADAGEEITRAREATAARGAASEAEIFDAHLLFLQDEALLEPARTGILERGMNAAAAWDDAVAATAAGWRGLDDEYLRARADDVAEVGRRVLARLLGVGSGEPALKRAGILVAAELAPGETAELDPELVLGIATAYGGPTSHSAILARALGVPAVVGAGVRLLGVAEGTELLVDGDGGRVQVAPPSDAVAEIAARRREREELERAAWAEASLPAITLDGVRIEAAANIASLDDVEGAIAAGAEGVGLLRTEFLFLNRPELPGEDEQARTYRDIVAALGGRPLILRTLDVGADKPLPSLPQPPEANPALGVRGVRLGLERPELLVTQLKAALRVAAEFPLKVMFPMVSSLDELLRAKALLGEARAALATDAPLDVGVMVEVPAAAVAAPRLAAEVDFFSIGTNDLAQYTLAADRQNDRVAALADAIHPSVLELIAGVVEAAEASGIWIGVCGEAGGDPVAVPLLVGLGVRELSAVARALPRVKQVVRSLDSGAARELASEARRLASAAEVRELVDGWMSRTAAASVRP